MSTDSNWMSSSLWGGVRGFVVSALVSPVNVVKFRRQCQPNPQNSIKIARTIFQNEGTCAFYKGLQSQLIKTVAKQVWVWPMLMETPAYLERHNVKESHRLALTGLAVATIDAAVTTPLERIRIQAATTGKSKFSLHDMYRNGWRGFPTHWTKLSVNWITFLETQKHLRNYHSKTTGEALSLPQLVSIGAEVAVVVSVVSAPFDVANTLKQAKNINATHLFSGNTFRTLFRGAHLNALSLTIHNVASVIVIDRLGRRFNSPKKA